MTKAKLTKMPRYIDVTGQRFGRLVAKSVEMIPRAGNRKGCRAQWLCACDCGNETKVVIDGLRSGKTKSCGCLMQESRITHGMSTSKEYDIWVSMKQRCTQDKEDFKHYHGKGLTVSDEWMNSFEVFIRDMGPKPTDKHTLDRIDNDKGYSKENCRWATRREQGLNRSDNKMLTYNGETKTATEWAESMGITVRTIFGRLSRGWTDERAITTPAQMKNLRNK